MKSLAPNTLLQNRYLIVQLIGKGGMGEVYLAVDQRLGSAVALKRMLFTNEETLGNAFEREAKMLARLRHPALTKVSDHFTENDTQYLVMEHISGEDLAKRLEQNQKPFPLSWVLFWADQLLDALTYLHSHEPPIIHRDIKPQNLKLTNENHIMLLDFGLAKNEGGETRFSTTGDVVAYTPNYASMEQIRGTGTTARSDIYSLCATMYQLLTNTTPADALTRADSVLNNLPDPVRPLNELNPEVLPALAKVISKGMNLSAEQRYSSAKEMQTALREAFAQVQSGMSADTVAFNVNEDLPNAATTPEIKQEDIKTEIFIPDNVSEPVGEKTEVMPFAVDSAAKEKGVLVDVPKADATLPFVAPLVFNENEMPQPAGEKTEVMPFDLMPPVGEKTEVMPFDLSPASVDKTDVIPFDSEPDFGAKTVVSPIEFPSMTQEKTEAVSMDFAPSIPENAGAITDNIVDFTASNVTDGTADTQQNVGASFDSVIPEGSYPEGTVQMVNFGEQVLDMPSQETANFVSKSAGEMQTVSPPRPEVGAAAQQNSGGGGRILIFVGVLALLGLFALGATGVGLYVFKPELFSSATPTPEPTIEATPTISPNVTPTVDEDLQLNTNTGNIGGDFPGTNSNINTNSDRDSDNSGSDDKTPVPADRRVTPVPGKTNAPKTNRQNVPKTVTPEPKTPTPVKKVTPDRTRIAQ